MNFYEALSFYKSAYIRFHNNEEIAILRNEVVQIRECSMQAVRSHILDVFAQYIYHAES